MDGRIKQRLYASPWESIKTTTTRTVPNRTRMPPLICLSQKLSTFQGQISLDENILATVRETLGAQFYIMNNIPVKFEGFCSSTFADMRAKILDGRTYKRTRANLCSPNRDIKQLSRRQ